MTHDIIVLILSVILGIALYWRESKRNALYRFVNRLTHSKKLQLPADSKKGFLVQQSFLMRLFYLILLFLAGYGLASLILPFISQFALMWFVSSVVGCMIGTYLASALLFAEGKIQSSDDLMDGVVEKGKEKFEDLKEKGKEIIDDLTEKDDSSGTDGPKTEEGTDAEPEKSARDKFKDKGYIK